MLYNANLNILKVKTIKTRTELGTNVISVQSWIFLPYTRYVNSMDMYYAVYVCDVT